MSNRVSRDRYEPMSAFGVEAEGRLQRAAAAAAAGIVFCILPRAR